jgi:ADP-heptose:LPS heptosyltransferase
VRPILIRGMWGLGDNVYSRPFVRAAALQYQVHLETPWPELYEDLDIKFVLGKRKLRTQLKNIARQQQERWFRTLPMREVREVQVSYGGDLTTAGSIISALERRWYSKLRVAFDPALFDLPDMGPPPLASERPIAVVRPVTVRSEWRGEARSPRPEYVNAIAAELLATHTVVAVADLEPDQEWAVGELPPAHHYRLFGELNVRELLALVRAADIVVGGVGWIVPVGIALKVRTFVVLGGQGGHNAPAKITDPRLDLSRIGFAMPERFCQCTSMLHACDKTIADPLGQFSRWAAQQKIRWSRSSQLAA